MYFNQFVSPQNGAKLALASVMTFASLSWLCSMPSKAVRCSAIPLPSANTLDPLTGTFCCDHGLWTTSCLWRECLWLGTRMRRM